MSRTDARRKRGRPSLSDRERARRGTLQPSRTRERQTADPRNIPTRPYIDLAESYARDVAAGTIAASRWVQLAVERQGRDLARARTDPTCPFIWSPRDGIAACHFLEQLPHVEGYWSTATIQLAPWQVFLVLSLFGWRQRHDRRLRRITNLYLETGRKSAKSTLMAGLVLYHLLEEDEPGAQVVCGATTGSQARIVFAIAQRMVQRSRYLQGRGLMAYANAIFTTGDGAGGTIKPINAKASTQDGLNPSCIVLDESHAQTFELHDVLKSAQGARRNPLLMCPTTAGYNLLSVGYALRTAVTKMLEQVLEADHLLGLIYTLDEGDDWRDPRVWIKANPMLGTTPTVDWVRRYCLDAQATPGLEAEFRVKVCSEWANAASTWLSMTAWDRCADPSLTLEQFAGHPCWIGADLAQIDDLAAVALVFHAGEAIAAFVHCYLPAGVLAERARAVPQYRLWANDGLITCTEGTMIDYARIEQDIRGWCQQFTVRDLVFDQFGATQITGNLFNSGLPARMEQKNAKSCTPPARELEARVKHGRFRHDGNPCLKWQASNVVVTRRTDDTLLPKKDAPESPNKIDAIDALLNGIGALLRTAAPQSQVLIY